MSLVVFTGGARSGKSAAAQQLALTRALDGADVVVAVFGQHDGDAEFADRVRRHQADRPERFDVVEAHDSRAWPAGTDADALLVVDCLGTLLGLVMSEEWTRLARDTDFADAGDEVPAGYSTAVEARVSEVVSGLVLRRGDTIIVTNEVGDGVVPPYATGRIFRDIMGRANRDLVSAADAAFLTVAGRLVDISSLPTSARWPQD